VSIDIIICAVVLLNKKNEALLQLRDNKEGLSASGLLVFPGGHRDNEENLIECAKREFLEETGYQCENLRFLLSIKDKFISTDIKNLHIYYDQYDFKKNYTCYEGVSLDFYTIEKAKDLKMPTYLIHIWELAILALQSNQPKIY
jgi:8-oxo-dGTP pyrophosphatase MutT (NUDIX family)